MPSAALLLLLLALSGGAHAGYVCRDVAESSNCVQWRRNMGGSCRGQDYGYMLTNCPKTCDLCDDASEAWEKAEEKKKSSPTYEPEDSAVIQLDGDSIDDFLESEREEALIFLEFYAPWCGHCQQVAPAYREAAAKMAQASEYGTIKTPVHFAKFDDQAPENRAYAAGSEAKWNFSHYPSLYLVGGPHKFSEPNEDGSANNTRFWGPKDLTDDLVFWATNLANGLNQTEVAIAFNDVEKRTKPGLYKEGEKFFTPDVPEFDEETFRDEVLRSDTFWVIEFFSEKCPICNTLAPFYKQAAEEIAKKYPGKDLRFGAVNHRVFHDLGSPYGITGHPWVTSFYLGKNVEHMAGMGGWESFYNWGIKMHTEHYVAGSAANITAEVPPPPPEEDDEDASEVNKDEL